MGTAGYDGFLADYAQVFIGFPTLSDPFQQAFGICSIRLGLFDQNKGDGLLAEFSRWRAYRL